jgi:hypothetical protein
MGLAIQGNHSVAVPVSATEHRDLKPEKVSPIEKSLHLSADRRQAREQVGFRWAVIAMNVARRANTQIPD